MSSVLPEPTEYPQVVAPGSRFGELTYTSFDDGSGSGGGWQVKSTAGELSDRERSALTAWISTRFDLEPPLPRFPTPADIDGRPARLMYAAAEGGAAYWHTVDAGLDGSGRPGNVFAHVVLDRELDASTSSLRPVELWKWSGWLTPYGARAVLESSLEGARSPVPDGPVTRARVLEFLDDPAVFRVGLFQVLLDAVAGAMAGGPSVVLTVSDADTAVMWIGAVSYFMSPGSARRFAWSTHDKAHSVAEGVRRGLHLIAVPVSDRDGLKTDPSYVVIDEYEEPSLGLLGSEPHVTKDGLTTVAVTPWSMLAQSILIDAGTAEQVLTQQDDLAHEVGDIGLSPMWPLAMAVASTEEVSDGHQEAIKVILEDSPTHVHDTPRLLEQVREIYGSAAPGRAAEAWRLLMQLDVRNAYASMAAVHYVERALEDEDWLFGPTVPPVVPPQLVPRVSDEVRVAIDTAVKGLLESARRPDIDERGSEELLFRALRVADLAMLTMASSPVTAEVQDMLSEVLERARLDVLFDDVFGDAFVARVGELSGSTLGNVVRPVVEAAPNMASGDFGRRLSGPVLRWLFPREASGPEVAGTGNVESMLFAEYVHSVLVSDNGTVEDREQVLPYAKLAVRHLLQADQRTDADVHAELVELTRAASLTVTEILVLFDEFGDRVPPGVAADSLLRCEYDSDLVDLINYLGAQHDSVLRVQSSVCGADCVAVAAASIRGIREWSVIDQTALEELVHNHAEVLIPECSLLNEESVPVDLAVNVCVLIVAAQSMGVPWAADAGESSPLRFESLFETHVFDIVPAVTELVAGGALDIDWVVAQAILISLAHTSAQTDDSTFIGVLGTNPHGQPHGPLWLDDVAESLVQSGRYAGPRTTSDIRDAIWPDVRNMSAARGEETIRGYEPVAAQWLREFGIGSTERQNTWIH
ncbi:hypothetical protein CJ179_34460 [Rhodococcus sp. ACS1]|uniref:Uncharacterized protein n=1 Tax=Rhodococcus jostii TaxID=132919 RepID=A0A1H5LVI4_RHOJO|nr:MULTISPECIES: hypothetical protein [Rhodococcus]PBC39186.1 hypothetical protein CJ179_34460 [Rhodococcus sp. ACS1]SEE80391.1 hypothetical protein SAMN04490220_8407 [Rhodococcus jostii]